MTAGDDPHVLASLDRDFGLPSLFAAPNEASAAGDPGQRPPSAADVHAFVALYGARYEQLCRYAFRYVRSRQDAEEIVHDVFLRLWIKRWRDGDVATVDSWANHRGLAYAAVRNEAIDRLRRRRREVTVLESVAGSVADRDRRAWSTPEDEFAEADVAAELQRAVDQLPGRVREVLVLKWERGMTNAQVAQALGIARKTVEMHVTRAARALRRLLRPSPGDREGGA